VREVDASPALPLGQCTVGCANTFDWLGVPPPVDHPLVALAGLVISLACPVVLLLMPRNPNDGIHGRPSVSEALSAAPAPPQLHSTGARCPATFHGYGSECKKI
jgi:hypothetical protein